MDNETYQALRRSIINEQVERYLAKIEAARITYAPCSHPCIECDTSHAEPTAACDTSCDHYDWQHRLERDAEEYLDGEEQASWDAAGDLAYAASVGK